MPTTSSVPSLDPRHGLPEVLRYTRSTAGSAELVAIRRDDACWHDLIAAFADALKGMDRARLEQLGRAMAEVAPLMLEHPTLTFGEALRALVAK